MPDDDRDDADDASLPPPSSVAPIPEALRVFLGLPSTQDLILRVVLARVFKDAPEFIVDDLVSNANFACMTARRPPDDPTKTAAWVAGVTVNTVRTYFRRGEKHLHWLNREMDVEEVAASDLAEGPLDARVDVTWLLEPWLDQRVAKSPTDRMTLEIIRHKARTAQTDEQVVAHFCLSSVSALSSRIHYFKKKYLHQRQRYLAQRRRTLMLLLQIGAAVLAGVVIALVVWILWRPPLSITAEPPYPSALPSSSADAGPPPFHQAEPTRPDPVEPMKPARDKP